MHERGIEPHIPVFDKASRSDGTFSRPDFAYDHTRDCYICPAGKELSQWFCQLSRQRFDRWYGGRGKSRVLHDAERKSSASCEADTAGGGGDDLVVTADSAEEVKKFAMLSAEAVGGIMALEAAHTSDPWILPLMPRWSYSSRLFR